MTHWKRDADALGIAEPSVIEVARSVLALYAEGRARTPIFDGAMLDLRAAAERHDEVGAAREARLRRELGLVYDELNQALGQNAPKAWDRIKARLDRG